MSVACWNSGGRDSRHSSWPNRKGELAPDGDLRGGDRLRGVPHGGEAGRRDLEVQLHGGAGRLGHDRLRGARQPLDPVDVQGEVLAARGHDLVVEQRVAVDVGKVGRHQVVPVERRQNTDHHDSGVDLARLSVGICQRRGDFLGEPVEYPAAQSVWGYVDFQVEHGEFCLEIATRDPLQYLAIQHFRLAVVAREIQFDLQTHEVLGAVEALLGQEPLEPRQTPSELVPVVLTIGQVECACHDLLAHRSVPPRAAVRPSRPPGVPDRKDDAQPGGSITSPAVHGTRYADRKPPAAFRWHIHRACGGHAARGPFRESRSREKRRREWADRYARITRGHRGATPGESG